MPTETETLADYIEAARLMGEVTGEDLLEGLSVDWLTGFSAATPNGSPCVLVSTLPGDKMKMIPNTLAISILRDRVWRAVRGWVKSRAWHWLYASEGVAFGYENALAVWGEDLPSAVAAIHKYWKESQ